MARADRPAPFAALAWPLASLRLESPFSGMSFSPVCPLCGMAPRGWGQSRYPPEHVRSADGGCRKAAADQHCRRKTRVDSRPRLHAREWSAVFACSRRTAASARVRDQLQKQRWRIRGRSPGCAMVHRNIGRAEYFALQPAEKTFRVERKNYLTCVILAPSWIRRPFREPLPSLVHSVVRVRREGRVPAVERRRTCGSSP